LRAHKREHQKVASVMSAGGSGAMINYDQQSDIADTITDVTLQPPSQTWHCRHHHRRVNASQLVVLHVLSPVRFSRARL